MWTVNVLAASAATIATLSGASSAFADEPPPIVTTAAPQIPPWNPLFEKSRHSILPDHIVQATFRQGAAMAPYEFRPNGIEDGSLLSPIQHPGRILDRIVDVCNAFGLEIGRPESETAEWMIPAFCALVFFGVTLVLMHDYGKRPLTGGRTEFKDTLSGAMLMLSVVGAAHTLPYVLSGDLRFNYASATANYIVMGMWAVFGAWSLVAGLQFRFPGKAFAKVFMRKRTRYEPFILTGVGFKKFIEATRDDVRKLIQEGKGGFSFRVEASELERPEVHMALSALGEIPVTATIENLSYEEFLTVRPVLRHLQTAKILSTITASSIRYIKKRSVGPPLRQSDTEQPNTTTILMAGGQLPDDELGRLLVARGDAYWQGQAHDAQGRLAITKHDIPCADLPTTGQVVRGVLKEERTVADIRKKSPHNATYTIIIKGNPGMLVALSDQLAKRPIIKTKIRGVLFGLINYIPKKSRRLLHRTIWPTNVNISLSKLDDRDETCDAVCAIASAPRYAVQPKPPIIPLSRAVIDSIVSEKQPTDATPAVPLILAIKATEWDRHASSLSAALGTSETQPSADYKGVVTVTVPSDKVLIALSDRQSLFAGLTRKQKIGVMVPLPLLAPKDVLAFSLHEDTVIKVPPGDLTPLEDVKYPKDRPPPVHKRIFAGAGILRRTTSAGVRNGRIAAIGGITAAGIPLAAPVTFTTKMLTGYTEPATWAISAIRLLGSIGIGALILPVLRARFTTSRLNNFFMSLPALVAFVLPWEVINELANDEPPQMWFKKTAEELSYEGRPAERTAKLTEIQEEERKISDREFAINLRLGNLLATGHYTADDVTVLRSMYDKIEEQKERARFLAGLMNDPGFAYLVQQDVSASAFFTAEIGKYRQGIRTVLRERPEVDTGRVFAQWEGATTPNKVDGVAAPHQRSSHALPSPRTSQAFKAFGRTNANSTFNRGGQPAKWR